MFGVQALFFRAPPVAHVPRLAIALARLKNAKNNACSADYMKRLDGLRQPKVPEKALIDVDISCQEILYIHLTFDTTK